MGNCEYIKTMVKGILVLETGEEINVEEVIEFLSKEEKECLKEA